MEKLRFIIGLAVVFASIVGLLWYIEHRNLTPLETLEPATTRDLAFNKKDAVLDYFIDRLADCESQQIPDRVHPHDGHGANATDSLGWLQFKQTTFDEQGKLYGLPHDDIMSPAQQIPIAKKMIQDGKWRHWENCGLKIGLDKYKSID